MTSKDDSPISRAQTSYQKLATVAANLNTASDQLGKIVAELEAALKSLNLGISSWVTFCEWGELPEWYSSDVGYDKVDGKWGIAIRSCGGDVANPQDDWTSDVWLFNDAPRALRLQAIDKIPDLLEKLVKDAVAFTDQINDKLKQSRELSTAISAVAKGTVQPTREKRETTTRGVLNEILDAAGKSKL